MKNRKYEIKCICTLHARVNRLCESIENVLCFKTDIGGMASFFVNNVACVLETIVSEVSINKDLMYFNFISRNNEKGNLYKEFFI